MSAAIVEVARPAVSIKEIAGLRGDVTHIIGAGGPKDRPWSWRTPGAPKPAILAFDTAKITGIASLDSGGRYCGCSIVVGADSNITHTWAESVRLQIATAAGLADRERVPLLVVVEDVFVFVNPKTSIKLARLGGAVISHAASAGLPVTLVQPSSWQSAMLGGRAERKRNKRLSIERAIHEYGSGISNDNEADAALMALWARGGHR